MEPNRNSNHGRLRARAIALRQAGWSNPRIRKELGISGWTLTALFQGHVEPVHEALAHRAKPRLRERARELRAQGWGYPAIARELRVSKSSLSLWLRDLPRPEKHHPGEPPAGSGMSREEWADFCARRQERYRRRKAQERRREVIAAAGEIGELTERELLIAGAVAYWCEGAKDKPWRRQSTAEFINSDPDLIGLYLRFLDLVGFDLGRLAFRVNIHEESDVEAATLYWMKVTNAERGQFRKPVIKQHNPKTVRRKTGDGYYGALTVYARRSAELYRRIEGWARAVMLGSRRAIVAIEQVEEPPW